VHLVWPFFLVSPWSHKARPRITTFTKAPKVSWLSLIRSHRQEAKSSSEFRARLIGKLRNPKNPTGRNQPSSRQNVRRNPPRTNSHERTQYQHCKLSSYRTSRRDRPGPIARFHRKGVSV